MMRREVMRRLRGVRAYVITITAIESGDLMKAAMKQSRICLNDRKKPRVTKPRCRRVKYADGYSSSLSLYLLVD